MRRLFAVLVALPVLCAAQNFGTKSDPVALAGRSAVTGSVGFVEIGQMILAMLIVVALLKFLLPKMLQRVNKKLQPTLGSSIKIEESANFAGGTLFVVTAREKTLLISVGAQGVQCLAELGSEKKSDEPAFFEVLDRAAVQMPVGSDASRDRARSALDRLSRLSA